MKNNKNKKDLLKLIRGSRRLTVKSPSVHPDKKKYNRKSRQNKMNFEL